MPVSLLVRPADTRASARDDAVEAALATAQAATPARRRALQDRVVADQLPLADALARRYRGRGPELEDLVQVARVGLVEAVRRYEPGRGGFVGFAVPTITGVLKRHFRDQGWLVRPPRAVQELSARIQRERADLTQELGAEPTDAAVAARVQTTSARVRAARLASMAYAGRSWEATLAAEGHGARSDGPDPIEQAEARIVLARAWPQLDPAERRLLALRFYDERSQSDIAQRIGVSQMQVSRLLARTLEHLRVIIAGGELGTLA